MPGPVAALPAMNYDCRSCGKTFRDGVGLRRHLLRKKPCTAMTNYVCESCGSAYAHGPSLSRHRAHCAGSEPAAQPTQKSLTLVNHVQNVQNIQNIHVHSLGNGHQLSIAPIANGLNVSHGAATSNQTRLPGWPDKWEVPAVVPHAFSPPGFEITLEQLESAVNELPGPVRAACGRGESPAVAQLLVGVLRKVHSNPEERNIYLNPKRSDQALIYIPSNWITRPLDDASRLMFGRIAKSLGNIEAAQRDVSNAISGVRQSCESDMPQLAKASRGALAAHLESLRFLSPDGADGLAPSANEEALAFLGKEWTDHITTAYLISAAETAAGVYAASSVTESSGLRQMAQAILECAHYVLANQTANYTIILADGVVYAHERDGWNPRTREYAAHSLVRRMATVLADKLQNSDSPLTSLNPWLRQRVPEFLESEEGQKTANIIVDLYLDAAKNYYRRRKPCQDRTDRREVARRLLAGLPADPPAVEYSPSLSGAPDPFPSNESIPHPPNMLTDSDINELLGFTVQRISELHHDPLHD